MAIRSRPDKSSVRFLIHTSFTSSHIVPHQYIPLQSSKQSKLFLCSLNACVFVCPDKQAASCQQGGVKRPGGFEHSCPAKLTVCLDNGIFPSPSTPPTLSLPAFAKNLSRQERPSSPPPLLSAHVHSLFLYLRSASISHYLPSSILFIEECPPTSPPAEQPHCHQSASSLLQGVGGGGGVGICILFSLHFLSIQPLHILSTCVILSALSCFLRFVFFSDTGSLTPFISFP